MAGRVSHAALAAVSALVAFTSAWMWHLQPERILLYGLTGTMIPVAWVGMLLYERRGSRTGGARTAHASKALAAATALLAASLVMALVEGLGILNGETADRVVGVGIGILLTLIGNTVPKALTPLVKLRCDPADVQAFRRFAGWTFVLTGIAYASTWLVLTADRAAVVSAGLAVSCLVTVMFRFPAAPPPARRHAGHLGAQRNAGRAGSGHGEPGCHLSRACAQSRCDRPSVVGSESHVPDRGYRRSWRVRRY